MKVIASLTGTGGTVLVRTGRNQFQAPVTPLPTPSSAFAGANNRQVNNRNSGYIMPSGIDAQARRNDSRALPTTMSRNAPAHSRTTSGTRAAQRNGWRKGPGAF